MIWTAALPKAQLAPVAAPCFERYPPKFDPATGLGGFEIWLPLEIDSATAAS
jgi:AraC family transcriptional regulator